jgi:anti-anti-sigma factor
MELSYFEKFNQMEYDTKITPTYMDKKKTKVIVAIHGDMEGMYAKSFNMAIFDLFNNEPQVKTVILDFKDVHYVSSSFIASMLHMIQHSKSCGIELFFANLLEHMEAVIDSLGMGHFVVNIDMEQQGPIDISCYNCNTIIKVKKLGEMKCPSCGTLLKISNKGVVRKED